MNNIALDFLNKVFNILTLLGIDEKKEEVLKNILGSQMINFSRLITTDETMTPIIESFTNDKNNDPNDLLKFLDSKNIDYNHYFLQAGTESLNSFISKLEPSLPPEKVASLRALI